MRVCSRLCCCRRESICWRCCRVAACNCLTCCSNLNVDVGDAGVGEGISVGAGVGVAPGFAIITAGAGAGVGVGVAPGFAILGVGSGFCSGKLNVSLSCQPCHISRASIHRWESDAKYPATPKANNPNNNHKIVQRFGFGFGATGVSSEGVSMQEA